MNAPNELIRLSLVALIPIIAVGFNGSVKARPPESGGSAPPVRWMLREETIVAADVSFRPGDGAESHAAGNFAGTGGDTCNEATVVPVPVGRPGKPFTVTIRGDSAAATGPDCDPTVGTAWWEAFEIDQCADVTIDFCDTISRFRFSDLLGISCETDGNACGRFLSANVASFDFCGKVVGYGMLFEALPAGTYYYPIVPDPDLTANTLYRMRISAARCQEPCEGCLGGCCNPNDRSCTDNVPRDDCAGPEEEWFVRNQCSVLQCSPPGAEFDAVDVTLLSHVPVSEFPSKSSGANDIWGYVSPAGREYAIIGLFAGTGFVDVTDPANPVIVADISDDTSLWSDIAVYEQYAYNVNERGGGMQIIDLTRIDDGVVTLVGALTQAGLRTAHNVFANPDSGFLYLCGANSPDRGLVAVDVRVPDDPFMVGIWDEEYAHDVYVVSYDDCPYVDRTGECEIAFVFAGGAGLKIVDVTMKTNMTTIATVIYPNLAFCHQGWLSEDRRHLFFDDEADENRFDLTTTTHVVNVEDVGNPQYIGTFTNGRASIDHNLMVRGQYVFEANYTSGLRIYDVGDVNNIQEVAFFDTHPEGNARTFDGAWGVFTGFPSGLVVVSDLRRGLFVLAPCFQDSAPAGDFNGDGAVDLRDFSRLQRCFGPGPLDAGCKAVDMDCDRDVDLDDYSAFVSARTGRVVP